MVNLRVQLENPNIILMPITEEEVKKQERCFRGDESIYILYKTSADKDTIQIGMLSSSVSKNSPELANLWRLKDSTSMAYFYGGCVGLEQMAFSIKDRPVYCIRSNDDRSVAESKVLNATLDNGLDISLDAVIDGEFVIGSKTSSVQKKKGSIWHKKGSIWQ